MTTKTIRALLIVPNDEFMTAQSRASSINTRVRPIVSSRPTMIASPIEEQRRIADILQQATRMTPRMNPYQISPETMKGMIALDMLRVNKPVRLLRGLRI